MIQRGVTSYFQSHRPCHEDVTRRTCVSRVIKNDVARVLVREIDNDRAAAKESGEVDWLGHKVDRLVLRSDPEDNSIATAD